MKKKILLIEQIACIPPNFGALSSKITFVFAYHVQFFLKKTFQFSADLEQNHIFTVSLHKRSDSKIFGGKLELHNALHPVLLND